MNNRNCILFLLVASVLMGVANFLTVRFDIGESAVGKPVLLADPDSVCGIALDGIGREEIVLMRRDGRWRLVKPYAGDVDESVVLKALDALALSQVVDEISDGELLKLGRSRADFALDRPALTLGLQEDDGTCEQIGFGAVTPVATGVYASIGEGDSVFVMPIEAMKAFDLKADDLRERALFDTGLDVVSRFEVRRSAGEGLRVVREGDAWRVGDEVASAKKVRDYLSDLLSAKAVSFVWPVGATNEASIASASLLASYGLDPESALTVAIKDKNGSTRQLSFGKVADDASLVYALVRNESAIVTVSSALKDALMRGVALFTDSRLFPMEAGQIAAMTLSEGADVYSLVRNDAGEWRFESPIVAPADRSAVETLIDRIVALSPNDVDANGVRISMSTNAVPVAVSRAKAFGDLRYEDLRRREILRIDPAVVKRVVSTSGEDAAMSASVVYDRSRGAWAVEKSSDEGAAVAADSVADVLAAVNPLTAQRIARLKVPAADLGDYGLDKPFLTVAIDQDSEDSIRRNIIIGDRTKGGRFATVGSAESVFVLADETIKRLSSPLVSR